MSRARAALAVVIVAVVGAAGCTYTVDLDRRDAVTPSPATGCLCATWTAPVHDTADTGDTGAPRESCACRRGGG